jgi:acyl-CoA thioesterase-1
VLGQLRSDSRVIAAVRAATIVEIEIGANDVAFSGSCGTVPACYLPTVPVVERNLAAIVARVHRLATGHDVLVVLLDYWNVWLGGRYAAARGGSYESASDEVTDEVNGVIRATASDTGSAYVDLRAAFMGPDYAYDETHFLAADGDHPNASGHRQIATSTLAVIRSALRL